MNKRNGAIDFWKFAFSVIIIIFHGQYFATGNNALFPLGALAVEFFFIVSGVYFARSIENARLANANVANLNSVSLGKQSFSYVWNRIKGFCPNYYIAFIISFCIANVATNAGLKKIVGRLFFSIWDLLFITEGGMKMYNVNGVAWYLGSMVLVMLLLYPIIVKKKDMWYYVWAPLIVAVSLGILYQKYGHLRTPDAWMGLVLKGTFRAFTEITLGTIIYKVGTHFYQRIHFKLFPRVLLTIMEFMSYGVVIYHMTHGTKVMNDFVCLFALAFAVLLSYSEQTFSKNIFGFKVFSWLGTFSFSMYLGHLALSHRISDFFPELSYKNRMFVYLGISCATALFIHFFSILLRWVWKKKGQRIKALFIVEK